MNMDMEAILKIHFYGNLRDIFSDHKIKFANLTVFMVGRGKANTCNLELY